MAQSTDRHALPFIETGQAQKEVTHNEALARLDLLVMAAALDRMNDPPAAPQPGQCWIVGDAPGGEWSGAANALAGWTDSGWRLVSPLDGMRVWLIAASCMATWRDGIWRIGEIRGQEVRIDGNRVVGPRQTAIARPVDGATVDAEARIAIHRILNTLEAHGLIADT